MFVSSVVVRRAREECFMGTMHLNALNGSSDTLGQSENESSKTGYPFGGLFGVSLSDTHPYRPHDSGRTFHESRLSCCSGNNHSSTDNTVITSCCSTSPSSSYFHTTSSTSSTCPIPSSSSLSSPSSSSPSPCCNLVSSSPSPSSSSKREAFGNKMLSSASASLMSSGSSRHREALESLKGTSHRGCCSPSGPRRRSLDLDTVSSCSSRCRLDEISLSLEELGPRPTGTGKSFSRRVSDATISENETSDLDMASLSITEVDVISVEAQSPRREARAQEAGHKKRRRRAHTTDSTTSERAIKLLEKIKDSKRDTNSKHSRLREEDFNLDDVPATSSRSGHHSCSRHSLQRHSSDSPARKHEGHHHHNRGRKLTSRASVE
ncbi:putative protein TPRXL [Aplysia californica]|uniref:Uncharacterized protein n=1 Tax=Aplysia californica TaxID=6500 RepID=A0ABM0K0M7_APLCA|nr:putative protein TPRXL [Aplysia californica]